MWTWPFMIKCQCFLFVKVKNGLYKKWYIWHLWLIFRPKKFQVLLEIRYRGNLIEEYSNIRIIGYVCKMESSQGGKLILFLFLYLSIDIFFSLFQDYQESFYSVHNTPMPPHTALASRGSPSFHSPQYAGYRNISVWWSDHNLPIPPARQKPIQSEDNEKQSDEKLVWVDLLNQWILEEKVGFWCLAFNFITTVNIVHEI